MRSISVVTPWLGHADLIPAYEVAVAGAQAVIVDQANDAETAAALAEMCERLGNGSLLVRSEVNLGFAAANNLGLSAATGDIIVFLNNDIVGDPKGPNRWLRCLERDVPAGALVGPSIGHFPVDGDVVDYVEGWCLAATRSTWTLLDGWDAVTYTYFYAEDVDTSWRARVLGCELRRAHWPLTHLGNATSAQQPTAYAHADEQREKFRERYRAWKLRHSQDGNRAAAPGGNGSMEPAPVMPEYA